MTFDPIVDAARRGDLKAMEALYDEHRDMVYAVGLSVTGNGADADEVLQETFLRAFRSLSDWRGDSKLGTWLYSIALRTALNWKSRFLRRPERTGSEAATPPDAAGRAEAITALNGEIAKLPVQQRLVLTLKHLRGLSLAEIAEMQGCAVGTVKSNLHHAMVKLKGALSHLEQALI